MPNPNHDIPCNTARCDRLEAMKERAERAEVQRDALLRHICETIGCPCQYEDFCQDGTLTCGEQVLCGVMQDTAIHDKERA